MIVIHHCAERVELEELQRTQGGFWWKFKQLFVQWQRALTLSKMTGHELFARSVASLPKMNNGK
jgi:hypothetical protein